MLKRLFFLLLLFQILFMKVEFVFCKNFESSEIVIDLVNNNELDLLKDKVVVLQDNEGRSSVINLTDNISIISDLTKRAKNKNIKRIKRAIIRFIEKEVIKFIEKEGLHLLSQAPKLIDRLDGKKRGYFLEVEMQESFQYMKNLQTYFASSMDDLPIDFFPCIHKLMDQKKDDDLKDFLITISSSQESLADFVYEFLMALLINKPKVVLTEFCEVLNDIDFANVNV